MRRFLPRLYRRCSFNPRPPLLAGEWLRRIQRKLDGWVSIHARHCWRANERSTGGLAA